MLRPDLRAAALRRLADGYRMRATLAAWPDCEEIAGLLDAADAAAELAADIESGAWGHGAEDDYSSAPPCAQIAGGV